MRSYHKGSPLWIAGRVGILIVFVFMPLMRMKDQAKYKAFDEAYRKFTFYSDQVRSNHDKGDYSNNAARTNMHYWSMRVDEEYAKTTNNN